MKTVVKNIGQLATPKGFSGVSGKEMGNLDISYGVEILIEDGIISAVGKTGDFSDCADRIIDAEGMCVVPGFVDSHTHFIFGGYREDEFLARLAGDEYLEILKKGGGIQETVRATREAPAEELYSTGMDRLKSMLSQGVLTVEGKSGYGLDLDCEIKQLEVMKKLDKDQPVDIVRTYLGGHAVPLEYKGKTDEYIDFMNKEVIPKIAENELAEFCDVFCEDSVFSIEESRKILLEGQKYGLKSKIHADEIVPLGGGKLGAEIGAVSADHLLMVTDDGIEALSKSNTCATLLPCTAFCLNKPYAPARRLIDSRCKVALASDINPGSCFANSYALLMALAVVYMGMSMEEALCAITLNGAAAVGRADKIGSVEVGKKADFLILKYPSYKFLVYNTGANIIKKAVKGGEVVYEA